ncbi:MAG: hypothetical protein HC888_07455 [Candidatus Competibacteraceae bacterium]|nr:hypothetical protein [Candidatus Competibacteraceae bacterium]
MALQTAHYPTNVWDGTTPNRARRDDDSDPDSRDWDRISAEVIALQDQVGGSPVQLENVPDEGTADSGDVGTDDIVTNLQARVLQLEAILIAKGLALEAVEEE